MSEPVDERVAAQSNAQGVLATPGVMRFRRLYAGQDKAELFQGWASLTGTKLLRDALRDMALHAPPALSGRDEYLVQYGMSLGLNLAAQLAEDPSSVFPELFRSEDGRARGFSPLAVADDFLADPFGDNQEK